ncbi:MAG: 3-deoxy-D-manno-octulosonic-acid transferase [Betaproteobacteria bacterium]|nr:3-deoxy-D-manno-octulosonic-acid transferase [Betaproteobacteria bacterium]
MSAARAAYSALIYAMLPYVLARLAWRSRREPGYRAHVGERFGYYGVEPVSGPLIWLHAVSVGETRAAEPLVRALEARYPDHRLLLTHMTPTGRRAGESVFGDRVLRCYLPYDYPGAVGRFLDHFRPRMGLLMETEIWPNLIHACTRRQIPLYLVNARMSEKSYRGYSRFASLVGESMSGLTAVAAQTKDDAQRLRMLGARTVTVTGNVKFDATVPADQVEEGQAWRTSFGQRQVLLAASTREGEESLILDAYAKLSPSPLLMIVPRHPQRFDDVAALLEKRGLRYQRRSTGGTVTANTQVLLGDSMGEMAMYYAACDLAFIGGSLLPFGAHNFIEACAVGKPVLLGPHTYNFAEAAERATEAGALVRVEDATHLADTVNRLFADAPALLAIGARALEFSRAHQGATQRVMAMLHVSVSSSREPQG